MLTGLTNFVFAVCFPANDVTTLIRAGTRVRTALRYFEFLATHLTLLNHALENSYVTSPDVTLGSVYMAEVICQ